MHASSFAPPAPRGATGSPDSRDEAAGRLQQPWDTCERATAAKALVVGAAIAPPLAVRGGLVPIVTLLVSADDIDRALLDLAERIQALVGDRSPTTGGVIDAGELRIDIDSHRVTVAGEEVALTALEFKLLVALATRRERVQLRTRLLSEVWSCSPQNRTRTVDTHVKRLRDKLRSAERFIRTVRGAGYLFSEVPSRRGRRRLGQSSDPGLRSPAAPLRPAVGDARR